MQEVRIFMHYEKHSSSPEYTFLEALGFDKNKDKFAKIIAELKKNPQSSPELSKSTGIARSALNYYLDVLLSRGIVQHYNHKFHLIGTQFTQIVQYIETQTARTMNELKELAKEIDKKQK